MCERNKEESNTSALHVGLWGVHERAARRVRGKTLPFSLALYLATGHRKSWDPAREAGEFQNSAPQQSLHVATSSAPPNAMCLEEMRPRQG